MTRLLALAAAVLALLAWRSLRDRPEPVQPDPADDVQPADPVTFRYVPGYTMPLSPGYGTGDFWPQPWVNTSRSYGTGGNADAILEPLTAADRDWLDQTVRPSLHPST